MLMESHARTVGLVLSVRSPLPNTVSAVTLLQCRIYGHVIEDKSVCERQANAFRGTRCNTAQRNAR